MTRRVHIDRLELDVRGVPPATAEAAARVLGPALAQALGRGGAGAMGSGRGNASPGHPNSANAGRIDTVASIEPRALAAQVAGHIVRRISGDRS